MSTNFEGSDTVSPSKQRSVFTLVLRSITCAASYFHHNKHDIGIVCRLGRRRIVVNPENIADAPQKRAGSKRHRQKINCRTHIKNLRPISFILPMFTLPMFTQIYPRNLHHKVFFHLLKVLILCLIFLPCMEPMLLIAPSLPSTHVQRVQNQKDRQKNTVSQEKSVNI